MNRHPQYLGSSLGTQALTLLPPPPTLSGMIND
jgi:hypothetical protein